MLLEEEPMLDVNGIYLAKLVDVYRKEDSKIIYFTFVTCGQPKPIYIYGRCFADLTEESALHRWLMIMHGSLLDIDSDSFEIGYITGSYVNLTVEEHVYNGRIQYYVKDILNLVRIPLHASSDEYQIDPELLERTPI